MQIENFMESLKDDFTSDNSSQREKAFEKLNQFLSNLKFSQLNPESVKCLVSFYLAVVAEDNYKILPIVLDGLKLILDFVNFNDENAVSVVCAIVRLPLQDYEAHVRIVAFNLVKTMFRLHNTGLKKLDLNFVQDYLVAISNETNPEAVLSIMELNTAIARHININTIQSEFFENISIYFPVQFKNSASFSVTREQLVQANKASLTASPLFAEFLLPLLLEKLGTELESTLLETVDILRDYVDVAPIDEICCYHLSIMDSLRHQFNKDSSNTISSIEQCLCSLMQVMETKASEKDILELSASLYENLSSIHTNGDEKAVDFITLVTEGRPKIWVAVCARFLPILTEKILKDDFRNYGQLEVLVTLLKNADDLSRYKGLIDSKKMGAFFVHTEMQLRSLLDAEDSSHITGPRAAFLWELCGLHVEFGVAPAACGSGGDQALWTNHRDAIIELAFSLVDCGNTHIRDSMLWVLPRLARSDPMAMETVLTAHLDGGGPMQTGLCLDLTPLCLQEPRSGILARLESGCATDSAQTGLFLGCLASLATRNGLEVCEMAGRLLPCWLELNRYSELAVQAVATLLTALPPHSGRAELCAVLKLAVVEKPSPRAVHWFCSLLARLTLQEMLQMDCSAGELLNLIFALAVAVETPLPLIAQTYANCLNKMAHQEGLAAEVSPESANESAIPLQLTTEVALEVRQHLNFMVEHRTTSFVLPSLRALLLASGGPESRLLVEQLVILLTNPERLAELANDVSLLYCGTMAYSHPFYEQQLFYLLASKVRDLADSKASCSIVRDNAMVAYLQMVAHMSPASLLVSQSEIGPTLIGWLPLVAAENCTNIRVKVTILRVLCDEGLEVDAAVINPAYVGTILDTLEKNYIEMLLADRLVMAKVVTWFLASFPDYRNSEIQICTRNLLQKKGRDHSRVVRMACIKAKLLDF